MNVAVESPELGRSIIAGGYQTNLHEHGKGFPLMLIHGSGPGVTAWANWRLVMPELAKQRRVIARIISAMSGSSMPSACSMHWASNRLIWWATLLAAVSRWRSPFAIRIECAGWC